MNYKNFSESAKLFGLPATEKHYEDAEAFIEKFDVELNEAAKAYLESTLAEGSPALLAEALSKMCDDPRDSVSCLDGILTYAFMSGFLAGKGCFKEIEAFKMKQLVENGDI
ncbi:MAG: hypothetical protein ACE5IC_06170 [Candidatus Brocadiales bacterium]